MKKIKILLILISICFGVSGFAFSQNKTELAFASDTDKKYYTVYDSKNNNDVLFLFGDKVQTGDQYISSDNKLYEIESVDEKNFKATANYKENVKVPVYNIKKDNIKTVNAVSKLVGIYHTHNDECYNDADGTDSVYGKGGIHDVGARLKDNFKELGISVIYDETLHLPHNSGAYERSKATASNLLKNKSIGAIFDIHRDATPKSEYETKVDGVEMSKIRMVVGAANMNSDSNKEFALSIKGYADEAFPGLIKDIYIGKGNYNQQLTERAMLFEMGTNTIEKEKVLRSTEPLAKVLDVVLYGSKEASPVSLKGLILSGSEIEGLATKDNSKGSLETLWVVLGALGTVIVFVVILFFTNKQANYNIKRFFSEIFAGIFGKKKPNRDI